MVLDKGLYEPTQGDSVKMNLSFAGCGFLGIYHVGVASCIREYAPHLVTEKVSGASAGAIAAVGLICNSDLGKATTQVLEVALKARSYTLGPLHPTFSIVKFVEGLLDEYLPYNAHELASGRLFISLTRMHDRKNVIVSQFDTRDDLIQALICSAYIPFYCGLFPPQYKGTYYLDGGLSNNIPVLDEHTITVSPFAGESDICPSDNSSCDLHVFLANTSIQLSTSNLYRFGCIMFPPTPESLSKMCQQGFDDCLVFLQRANLISCKRHLSIYTSLTTDSNVPEDEKDYMDSTAYTTDEGVSTSTEDEVEPALDLSFVSSSLSSSRESLLSHCDGNDGDDEMEEVCGDCKHRQHVAVLDSLPPQVVSALQAACDSVNHTILGRLYRFKMLRVLGVMASPWVIPAELVYTLTRRFFQWAPQMPGDMHWFVKEFYLMVKDTYAFIQASRHRYSARLTCQLAITDLDFPSDSSRHSLPTFSYHHHNRYSAHPHKPSPNAQRRSINMGFAMDFNRKGAPPNTHDDPVEYINEFRQQILNQKCPLVDLAELDSEIEESNTRLEKVFVDDQGKKHVHLSKVSKLHGGNSKATGQHKQHRHHGNSGGSGNTEHRSQSGKVDRGITGDREERRGSLEKDNISNDTFDNCLHFAQQMDSLLTYHYTSEDDPQTVRVAEIYSLDDPLGPIPESTVTDMSLAWDSFMEMKSEQSTESNTSAKSKNNKTATRLFNAVEEETILGVGEEMSPIDHDSNIDKSPSALSTKRGLNINKDNKQEKTPQNPSLLALQEISRISREVHFSEPESIIFSSPEFRNISFSQEQPEDASSELSPIMGDSSMSINIQAKTESLIKDSEDTTESTNDSAQSPALSVL